MHAGHAVRRAQPGGDGGVDARCVDGDHEFRPWISMSTLRRSLGSSSSMAVIFWTAWSTVVWSLPPKAWPISAREAWVSWRATYMATCRGKATLLVRDLAFNSESLRLKASPT